MDKDESRVIMVHLIYQTTNIVNGMIYIGKHSTSNINDGYIGSGEALKEAVEEYGRESFSCYPIFYAFSESDAYEVERNIVDSDFLKRKDVYNKKVGGNGWLSGDRHPMYGRSGSSNPFFGKTHSEEYRKQISLRMTGEGNHNYGKTGELNNFFGKKHTTETLSNMSGENHHSFGKDYPEEAKVKQSAKMSGKGNPMFGTKGELSPNYGRKFSDETKTKISESNKGKIHSEETKARMRKPKPIKVCPHCGKVGGGGMMDRWHFNNCKILRQ